MIGPKDRRYWLPITLGVLGLLLLGRVFIRRTAILIPEDLDVVGLVSLLSVAMVVAIHTIVRISMQYLRWLSVRQIRRETLIEHSRFLRRLDHELKNPLTTLRTGLSTLALTDLDAQQRRIIAAMETETVRLSRLVTDLRKLADLEGQPLALQPINIEVFVASIIQIEQDRFAAAGRVLTSQLDLAQPVWVADEDLLALTVHNLLDNAFKYTQSADSVNLVVSTGNELIFQVIDSGSGIPPEALPYVWDELYRTEQLKKTPGSGIGLALVKTIVERHQGTVTIDSQLGRGTTVAIALPPEFQADMPGVYPRPE